MRSTQTGLTFYFSAKFSPASEQSVGRDQAHLELPQLFLGSDVGEVTEIGATDSLLSKLQPGVQVGVLFHKLVPQVPPPLQPGGAEIQTHGLKDLF